MIRMNLLHQATVHGLVLFFLVGCGAPAIPVPTSTPITPTATPALTPVTPTVTVTPTANVNTYKSDDLDITFEYPNGWYVSSPDKGFLEIASKEFVHPMQGTYAKGEVVMEIIGVPPDLHAVRDPVTALYQYINFMGIDMPDKEPVHNIVLDGKEFIIGTYSENYIKTSSHGNRAPLFIAVYLTDQNTVIVDMYASPDDEIQLRKLFEDLIISIENIP